VYTDKLRVAPCLLSCLSAVSLLDFTSVARRILYLSPINSPQSYFTFYKNDTVANIPHFSKHCNHPAFHDVKLRGASVSPTSQFRVSAIFLLLNFSRDGGFLQ